MKNVMKGASLVALMIGLAAGQTTQSGAAKKPAAAKTSQAKPAAKPAPAEPEAKPYVPQTMNPPAGSVEIAPNEWRYIEKGSAGKPDKVWIYRRTPFGLAKSEEEPPSSTDSAVGVEAVDKGENVEFSTNSPFGIKRWTKKKTELDEIERAAWARASNKKTAK
jgi:hypothetical protein